jgi:hypothetical protein
MKKGIRYLLIAFLLCGCIDDSNKDEIYPVPNAIIATVYSNYQNITHQYLSVYSKGKYNARVYSKTDQYYLNKDTTFFALAPDINSDSVYFCFENKNSLIDTVGIRYKRKLFADKGVLKSIYFEISDIKIFYLSGNLNKDSSIVFINNKSNNYGSLNIRLYKN